jgi:arsenate reductase (glutaredoxin)
MSLTLYGIPTCDSVRNARTHLDLAGVEYSFVDLRANPPSRAQIQRWISSFGALRLRNTSGRSFRQLGPEKASFTDDQWAEAFAQDPMLLKRPIIERDGAPLMVGFKDPDAGLALIRAGG